MRALLAELTALLAIVATAAGCSGSGGGNGNGGTDPDPPVLAIVEVTPATNTLFSVAPGHFVKLTAVPKDQNGDNITGLGAATFSAANEAVATVAGDGTVTAAGAGTTEITASMTHGGVTQTGSAIVTVEDAPATATVTAPGLVFQPAAVDVSAGGTVTWTFGAVQHDVTFTTADAPQNIPLMQNDSASRDFPNNGSFQYRCTIHPGMNGSVQVH
jgi:plastocyanin